MGPARNCFESPKRTQKKQPKFPERSLRAIEELKETGKDKHLKARNTKKCYVGHIRHGQEWLASHFPSNNSMSSTPKDLTKDDIYSDPSFQAAFDHIPNHCSDKALSLFLTFKGFHQNLGKGMVEGI